jgi:hypothetical protein
MLLIDRALNASGLIWALKVSLNGSAFLLEIEILRRCSAVWVIAIQRPLSINVRRGLLRWSLLRPGSQLKDNWNEAQTDKTTDSLFHFYVHFTFLTAMTTVFEHSRFVPLLLGSATRLDPNRNAASDL